MENAVHGEEQRLPEPNGMKLGHTVVETFITVIVKAAARGWTRSITRDSYNKVEK
jgi:hypothetical protein